MLRSWRPARKLITKSATPLTRLIRVQSGNQFSATTPGRAGQGRSEWRTTYASYFERCAAVQRRALADGIGQSRRPPARPGSLLDVQCAPRPADLQTPFSSTPTHWKLRPALAGTAEPNHFHNHAINLNRRCDACRITGARLRRRHAAARLEARKRRLGRLAEPPNPGFHSAAARNQHRGCPVGIGE